MGLWRWLKRLWSRPPVEAEATGRVRKETYLSQMRD